MIRCFALSTGAAIISLIALQGGAVAQGENSDRSTYKNGRFGFSVDYPARFAANPPSGNNDGRVFAGPETKVKIVAYAGYLVEDFATERALRVELLREDDADITYSPEGNGWFVLSGYDSVGQIFYDRVITAKDCFGDPIIATVSIVYPPSRSAQIEPDIGWISKSLKGCK